MTLFSCSLTDWDYLSLASSVPKSEGSKLCFVHTWHLESSKQSGNRKGIAEGNKVGGKLKVVHEKSKYFMKIDFAEMNF